ncbi:hypothetical protein FRX31_006412 [Thalictrum thalictroides]|uniref:Uncharacterized protein n=1 Tax=Thalictrum thalictroides TaxID=46969 RepID=A0A7J6X5Y9_THATH|nr:hypothetical protein FRX31_006412 [Thalictrum thalictroides]
MTLIGSHSLAQQDVQHNSKKITAKRAGLLRLELLFSDSVELTFSIRSSLPFTICSFLSWILQPVDNVWTCMLGARRVLKSVKGNGVNVHEYITRKAEYQGFKEIIKSKMQQT